MIYLKKNNLAQVFTISRQRVSRKNHAPMLKAKVTHLASLLICSLSSQACNSLMHRRILKLFGTSVWHTKTMCHVKEAHPYLKGQGRNLNLIVNMQSP